MIPVLLTSHNLKCLKKPGRLLWTWGSGPHKKHKSDSPVTEKKKERKKKWPVRMLLGYGQQCRKELWWDGVKTPWKSNSLYLTATAPCYQTCLGKSDNYLRTKNIPNFSMNSLHLHIGSVSKTYDPELAKITCSRNLIRHWQANALILSEVPWENDFCLFVLDLLQISFIYNSQYMKALIYIEPPQ